LSAKTDKNPVANNHPQARPVPRFHGDRFSGLALGRQRSKAYCADPSFAVASLRRVEAAAKAGIFSDAALPPVKLKAKEHYSLG